MTQKKARILIIDDDPGLLRMTGIILQKAGYEVITAQSGAQGLKLADKQRPDLIILDIMMPDMNGFEVCQRLQVNPHTSRAPVLMLSAKGKEIDKVTGFQVGASDYVEKPVGVKELLARVEALLLRARYAPAQIAPVAAIVGAKGGVGVTSLAINLAAALAKREQSAALAELHNYLGVAHYYLNLSAAQNIDALLAKAPDELEAQEIARTLVRHPSGFQLLFGSRDLNSPPLSVDHVDVILHHLSLKSDFVLLDVPVSDAPEIRRAMERADIILLVTEPEYISLACAKAELDKLRRWKLSDRVFVVMAARSPSAMLLKREDVEKKLEAPVVVGIPPAPEMFQESARSGVPVVEAKPQSLAAQAIDQLVDWLLAQTEKGKKERAE